MRAVDNYTCYQCGKPGERKLLHPTQVLDKGVWHEGKNGRGYFDPMPRHKVLIQDYLGAPAREEWHAVSPNFVEVHRA
jgi:hypothetical protein